MASACVNNIGISSESFMDCPPAKYTSFGWLSPKISFNRDENALRKPVEKDLEPAVSSRRRDEDNKESDHHDSDPVAAASDFGEFEFQLEGADVRMLPADELFSDGKLVPLQLSVTRPEMSASEDNAISQVTPKIRLRNEVSPNDPYLFSPRAPTCSSRWKELLGLKRFYQNTSTKQHDNQKAPPPSTGHKSLKVFLHRSQKSSVSHHADSSLSLPLIHADTDNESISISSSRLSLSSSCSSSGHEHDDFPRHSLDSEKPNLRRSSNFSHHRSRQLQAGVSKEKSLLSSENPESIIRTGRSSLRKDPELMSADSPRMNSSGKIVFHSLERSSSSPSTLNGGPRCKYRGMERSYSANVRYTPVLNVPVCSLRGSSSSSSSKSAGVFGFPLFSPPSSQQKKDGGGSVVSSAVASGAAIKGLHINRKNRPDRA